jgi:hypothetical protein
LYVASGSALWQYTRPGSKKGKWRKTSKQPGGRILQIASTEDSLYALCYDNKDLNNKTIKKITKKGGSWAKVNVDTANYNIIQNIFSAGDTLFISAAMETKEKNDILYFIFYITDSGEEGRLGDGEIKGAVYDGTDFFICTITEREIKNKDTTFSNIIRIDGNTMEIKKTIEKENIIFMNIIDLKDNNNTIVSITREGKSGKEARNGKIYTVNKTENTVSEYDSRISFGNRFPTGALALYQSDSNKRLLLAGRQDLLQYTTDSGYTYGYLELEIGDKGIVSSKFKEPGDKAPSTVSDYELFKTTIGKYPVNYIIQTPENIDKDRTLFASTQKNGVWSYRKRDGKWQWNAEEKD